MLHGNLNTNQLKVLNGTVKQGLSTSTPTLASFLFAEALTWSPQIGALFNGKLRSRV